MSSRRRDLGLETCAVVGITFGPSVVFALSGEQRVGSSMVPSDFYTWGVEQLGWVLLIVYLLRRDETFEWHLPRTGREWAKEIAAGLFLLAASWYFSSRFWFVATTLGAEGQTTFWTELAGNPGAAFAFRITMLVSVLAEELFFRVYLQTRLSQLLKGKPFLVIPLSAGLFAVAHDYAPQDGWAVFATGLILGASYLMNRRIPRLVFAHLAEVLLRTLG